MCVVCTTSSSSWGYDKDVEPSTTMLIDTLVTLSIEVDELQKTLFTLLRLQVNDLVYVWFSGEAVGSC